MKVTVREAEVVEDSYHEMYPSLVIDEGSFFCSDEEDEENKDKRSYHFLNA